MAVELERYGEVLEELGEHASEVLHASWDEAARVFTPRGLERDYLQGALSLKALGRGSDIIASFIQSAPAVARELGEEAVREMLATGIKMYSKTSASVISSLFSTSPIAAERLGDLNLFRSYLGLIDLLLAQAPRGVRPMLDHLGALLNQLTLGGLRRWALWGAQAHRTDFDSQVKYFSLASAESLGVLQRERKGTLFVDVQRRLNMYLRALWGRDFFLRPTSGDFEQREGYRPFIDGFVIHLPDAYDDLLLGEESGEQFRVAGLDRYRAACAHAAAHQLYTSRQFDHAGLSPTEMAMVGLIEDARVEALAVRQFPGLERIWLPFHTVSPDSGEDVPVLMARMARALLDSAYVDNDPWVLLGLELFNGRFDGLSAADLSREIGLLLALELENRGLAIGTAEIGVESPSYRDDNRYIWEFEDRLDTGDIAGSAVANQVRKYVSVMEMVNAIDVPGAGDDANEIWILATEFFRDEEAISVNQQEGRVPPPEPYHYPEWDYQMQLERPAWCTVLEKPSKVGTLEVVDEIVVRHKAIVGRLKLLIEALQPQGVQRLRKQEDGDEIDLNAAIRAMVELSLGEQPDPRIMVRNVRKVRDLSVLLLLDLSESTNDVVSGSENTVLQLAQESAVLLADALNKIGDPFAIHGFDSNGRHDIEYFRFKDFDMPYSDLAKARLAGMTGQLSTRMGAAIRHAGSILKRQASRKKLLLVITDGEPADNDVRDPQYLRHDARKAVEEVGRLGITSFCLSLDARADQYVSRIFGPNNYVVLDHVQRLPEKLPILYMGLTR